MDFIFRKSTKKSMKGYGTIHVRLRSKNAMRCCTLGITIKASEWNRYKANKWTSSSTMASLGIRYRDFAKMMAAIRLVPEEDFENQRIKTVCQQYMDCKDDKHTALPAPQNIRFATYIQQYYEELKTGKRLKRQQSVPVSRGYMEGFKTVGNAILHYEQVCGKHFTLDDIDGMFRRNYMKWLTDRGTKPNTIKSHMRLVYILLKTAFEEGLTQNDAFLTKGFVPTGEQVDAVYLSTRQVQALIDLDMTDTKKLRSQFETVLNAHLPPGARRRRVYAEDIRRYAVARDIFVIGCLTGQRISDYKHIGHDMITEYDGKQFICLVQCKSKKKVMIPLDKRVRHILDKYNGVLPKINEPTFNRHLRLLAETIGWTTIPAFEQAKPDGSPPRRFCDMVSSHTARRTFATNAYSCGVPIASIMAVTGHSTEEKLRTYLHLQAEDKALLAARDMEGFLHLRRSTRL